MGARGFLWFWNWHVPGEKNGPVDTRTPRELGGTIRDGNRGNKTQAVVAKLLQRLPNEGKGTYVFLDNLFTSTKFLLYLRSLSIGATGTCGTTGGIFKRLIEVKKSDKDDHIP